jgi:ferrous iron transport protein B
MVQILKMQFRKIQKLLNSAGNEPIINVISPRYLSIKLLEADKEELNRIEKCVNYKKIIKTVREETVKIESIHKDEIESIITDSKYGFIEGALKETYHEAIKEKKNKSRKN